MVSGKASKWIWQALLGSGEGNNSKEKGLDVKRKDVGRNLRSSAGVRCEVWGQRAGEQGMQRSTAVLHVRKKKGQIQPVGAGVSRMYHIMQTFISLVSTLILLLTKF